MDFSWLTRRPIAHRGLHDQAAGIVENTLPAAEAAIARDFSIECDVVLSADGEVVVCHDETLERLTHGYGRVADKTMAQLRATHLKGSDARIPTLEELLDLVAGRVGLCIELKSFFPRRPDDRLSERVAALLDRYAGPVVTKSFDPEVLAACNRLMPGIAHGIVADDASDLDYYGHSGRVERFILRHLLHAPRTRPKFISYCVRDLPAPGPWVARKIFGLPVVSWTVRNAEDRARALASADQIIFEGFDPDATPFVPLPTA
ncbi:glycerophosphodiester phosphodiesterase [Siculibacillus lacustris]|uniref:Glycerophosphodiester phosphodiesterase n=1 Tax=Siculibacillus lacustris TaxID=1549641 RepID=A0A4Q9VI42_9HYPH|nr:glycerophosphodiester phosphodiesterase family protein [Siculibacillus lacustris]TBW34312.1 glycerophosphodiester phosphodiesterase [Siculibacillus lacustris]